jgi:thiol-disulfide isomerase/thioredoxin
LVQRRVPPPTLTLLTRAYCHLCDEMREALAPLAAAHGATVVERDVDADPALEARYGDLVPVLLLGAPGDGREVCHYRLDRDATEAALRGA